MHACTSCAVYACTYCCSCAVYVRMYMCECAHYCGVCTLLLTENLAKLNSFAEQQSFELSTVKVCMYVCMYVCTYMYVHTCNRQLLHSECVDM